MKAKARWVWSGWIIALALLGCGGGGSSGAGSAERRASLVAAPVYAGCGTATVDGTLSPGEWDNAISVRFPALLPELSDGAEAYIPAEVSAMSDDQNLYVAFRLFRNLEAYAQSMVVSLDADESGRISAGDDELVFSWSAGEGEENTLWGDTFRYDCIVHESPGICSGLDEEAQERAGLPDGTSDGTAKVHFGADETTFEFWHPYTGEDPRDVLRRAGEYLSMQYGMRFLVVCPFDVNTPAGRVCYADTTFPPPTANLHFRPFHLGCNAPPAEQQVVKIRVNGLTALAEIVPGAEGSTSVAILSALGTTTVPSFDATSIDPATLYFAGAAPALDDAGAPRVTVSDVDGDGLQDLVAEFPTAALQLVPDAEGVADATLAGMTAEGLRFHGTEDVLVVAAAAP